ncbi:hypothetical protein ACGF5M_03685 [Gemmatimonadota bacterium]
MAVPTWLCPVCERHYRLSQLRCTKCGTQKPEGEWEEGVRVAEAAPRVRALDDAPPEAVQETGELQKDEKVPFWAHIVCGWPLILVLVGGAIGGGLGGLAWALNLNIFKSDMPVPAKIVMNLVVGGGAIGLWFSIAMGLA